MTASADMPVTTVVAPVTKSHVRQRKWTIIRLATPRGRGAGDLLVRDAKAVRWARDNPDEWAQAGQIASAPTFADWVDDRYADVLQPLYLTRD